jgi:Uma2 family endonuclease
MGETDVHIDWMIRIRDILRYRYQGERVYVGANLLVYYVEGDPSKFVVPDDFVVKDCDPGRRRTFKIWEECRVPNVVFEVTSRSSRVEDAVYKPQIYARLGVKEYFLYDPTAEYLDPPLQGFRLEGPDHVRIEPSGSGALKCEELGILLRRDGGDLVLVDVQTGRVLITRGEAAEARAAHLEAEVERLRKELEQRPRTP